MTQATKATSVKFKKFQLNRAMDAGEVIALFTEEHYSFYIGSYMHIGQHSSASPDLLEELEDATPEEYAALRDELVSIGYTLNIL